MREIAEKEVNEAEGIGDWLQDRTGEMTLMSVVPSIQSGDTRTIIPFLVNAHKVNKVYVNIVYAQPDGSYVRSIGATGSLGDRAYFHRAMKGETVISDPVLSKSTGRLVTVVAIPVKGNNQITGVMVGSIELDVLPRKRWQSKWARPVTPMSFNRMAR